MRDLFPYQVEGANFLAERDFALQCDDMGLGKTVQTVRAADIRNARRVMVLCPGIVRLNWAEEFKEWSVYARQESIVWGRKDSIARDGLVVCSYDLSWSPEVMRRLRDWKPDVLVLDEGHYLMNPDTNRTLAAFGERCTNKGGIAEGAKAVWWETGTPVPRGDPRDLWPVLRAGGVYKYGIDTFRKRYCRGYWGKYKDWITTGVKNSGELQQLYGPYMIRRLKDQVLSLPPLTFTPVIVPPGEVDESRFFFDWERFPDKREAMLEEAEMTKRMVDVIRRGSSSEHWAMLRACASTWRKYSGLAKVDGAIEYISHLLDNGQRRVVVYAVHRDVVEQLSWGLAKYGARHIYGGTPARKRNNRIKSFRDNPRRRVLVMQPEACGIGINLTFVDRGVFVESCWRPDLDAQAAMRLHRIGQKKHVHIDVLGMHGTVDVDVARAVSEKLERTCSILDEEGDTIHGKGNA